MAVKIKKLSDEKLKNAYPDMASTKSIVLKERGIKEFSDLSCSYEQVRRVDLSSNKLKRLDGISVFRNATWLNVSSNALNTEVRICLSNQMLTFRGFMQFERSRSS